MDKQSRCHKAGRLIFTTFRCRYPSACLSFPLLCFEYMTIFTGGSSTSARAEEKEEEEEDPSKSAKQVEDHVLLGFHYSY